MMAIKHTRRISSLFSLGSNSSDKSVDTTKSSPSLAPPILSNEASAVIFAEPVSTELQITISPDAQYSSQEPSIQISPDNPSEAPLLPPDDPLSPVPQMILPLPENQTALIRNKPRSNSESRIRIQTDESEAESHVENRGGSRPASRVENKSASRPGSPPRLHQSTTYAERRLSRRRSWLPTKSKPEPRGDVDGPAHWLIRPDEKLPYDISPLIQFQKVNRFSPSQ